MTLPPIQLFLHTYSFRFRLMHDPDFDIVQLLDRCVADGNPGIGLNVNGPRFRHLGGDTDAHIDRVAAELRARDLEVDIETSGTDPVHLTRMLDVAVRLGARHLRTYTLHDGQRAQVLDATIRDLVEIGPIAEDRGVPVLVENHEDFTGIELARILERVDHAFVGALYDYGNSMMVHEDPIEALEAVLPWTRKAHLKDHVVMGGRVCGTPSGEGLLPIGEITERLLRAGMTRIAFENVWSYSAPLRPREDGLPEEPMDAPLFREQPDPGDPVFFLHDADEEVLRDPARVIALEEESYRRAQACVDRILADRGIVRA